jgi:phosphoribosylanthranilate isomerase
LYRVRVKICGITNIVDARMVEREGADAVGFVFWPQSPRVVPATRVAEITRVLSPLTGKVGVFYDAGVSEVEKTVRRTGLSCAQICGTPPGNDNDWRSLSRRMRMLRVLAVQPDPLPEGPPWPFCYDYMIDSGVAELPGAGGEPFDWSLIPNNEDESWSRLYVSGGLTSENVGELIKKYRPDAGDISAAVEGENGRKDPGLVHEFMEAVREAEYEARHSDKPPVRLVEVGGNRAPKDDDVE